MFDRNRPRHSMANTYLYPLLGLMLSFSPLVHGLASDEAKPLQIESGFAEMDDSQGIAVYKENVVATKGTMRMTGDVLTIYYTPGHEIKQVVMVGKLAHFKQRPDNSTVDDTGEAIRIEYYPQTRMVYLIEKAKVNRQGQIYIAHRMDYDTKRNLLTMKKATPGETTPSGEKLSSGSDRISVIIPPQKNQKGQSSKNNTGKATGAKSNAEKSKSTK